VRERAGARVIVDSSKLASDAFLLSTLPDVRVHVLHLVRDPRATAHSWNRRRLKDPSAPDSYFGRIGPVDSSFYWLRRNAVIEALLRRSHGSRYLLVRYEDFVGDPLALVRSVAELVGESEANLPFTGPRTVRLSENHMVAGNPRRFSSGQCEIRSDDEWRHAMPTAAKVLTTLPALPLMRRYRYPLWRV
jgi:hypothetical protein